MLPETSLTTLGTRWLAHESLETNLSVPSTPLLGVTFPPPLMGRDGQICWGAQ